MPRASRDRDPNRPLTYLLRNGQELSSGHHCALRSLKVGEVHRDSHAAVAVALTLRVHPMSVAAATTEATKATDLAFTRTPPFG
jgi:hypothetical protein